MRETAIRLSMLLALFYPANPALAQDSECLPAIEPFDYQIDKDHPLYPQARDEFQRYLQDLEAYALCLDKERALVFHQMEKAWKDFNTRFGKDAVFKADIEDQ